MNVAQRTLVALAALGLSTGSGTAGNYGPGASDTEIKLGQTMPYSGPASAFATIANAQAAYMKMINEKGGINGRKINLISLDDGYNPTKAVEQTRRLIEQEEVLAIFQTLGTASNAAIQKYLNQKRIPQLFIASGTSRFNDPKNFPYTTGWSPNYASEGAIYAKYILTHMPNSKVGILYQNDDLGRDYLKGFKDALGEKAASLIVKEVPYEVSDPTVESQILILKDSGADAFFNVATPKAAAQAIRRVASLGWKPTQFLTNFSASVGAVLTPAGLENAKDIISSAYQKDPSDPQWKDDEAVRDWNAWMDKYNPSANKNDILNVYGYNSAQTMVTVLEKCGNDLTRENLMNQASHLNFQLPMLLPGVKITTSPTDLRPMKQMWLQKFDGARWVLFGDVIDGTQ